MPSEKETWELSPEPQEASPDELHDVCLDEDAKDTKPLPTGTRPEYFKTTFHECIFVILIAFAAAIPVFLQRSVVVVTGSMAENLQMTPAQVAWVTASSELTTGAFLLPFGYIFDNCPKFPRKSLLKITLGVFALLVSCTCFSPNGIVLDILSGLTGIACAANLPLAVGILSLVYPTPSRRKNVVFSSFLMGTPAATIIGGLGSGALALKLGWKAPFIVLVGFYALVYGLSWIFVPSIAEPESDHDESEVIISTLGAAMSFYSQLFWVSLFMQELEGLKPFDVAVRLLPQALMGLILSPLVGLIMHRVPGTALLAVASTALVASNVLLIFMRQGGNYLAWIFPSIMLSTIGMDWTMNVGSLYILSSLPLKQHSIGASILQTASRLAVPLGMGITTAIWSSYDGKRTSTQPELAYTNTFMTTTAFAGISLAVVPFIRIGRQGHSKTDSSRYKDEEAKANTSVPPQPRPTSPRTAPSETSNRPSKRWSPVDTLAATSTIDERKHTVGHSESSRHSRRSADTSRTDSTARTTIRHGRSPSEKVVWVVCEDCGTSKRHTQQRSTVGDPNRYFNDPALGGIADNLHHPINPRGGSLDTGVPNHHHLPQPQLPRPYGGRRRLPLVNRQIMTHQMLTQGFQP
ncbi:hypothetical protein M426DRAFT_260280 [Hypoxylon sp. CI-4A]|nr:hypothetical protein M426DRAFT_260280 [Hypoxylon sp. CI-4A]